MRTLRTIIAGLLCVTTFVATAMGFSNGAVLCRDADGCVAVEREHATHGGCHSDDSQNHDDGPTEKPCSDDDGTGSQHAERSAAASLAVRFLSPVQSPPVLGTDANLIANTFALLRGGFVEPAAEIPRREAVGLSVIVLLA